MPPTTRIVPSVVPDALPPRTVVRELRALVEGGARLLPAGTAKDDPLALLDRDPPRSRLSLFDVTYYLTGRRYDQDIGFLVGYVAIADSRGRVRTVYPRIFYKDSSLVWRVATHVVRTEDENWIGKGDVCTVIEDGHEHQHTMEETTNLPFEIQGALDVLDRRGRKVRDEDAVELILRSGPTHRMHPYADFSRPKELARERAGITGPIASFARRGDPESLRFRSGWEPDFGTGLIDVCISASRLYGGGVRKFRIASTNRRAQWQFLASPTHVWVNPPQALTTEITTYGVRALDLEADEGVFVPGFEYHFVDPNLEPPELYSQIPSGWAGEVSPVDPDRADAAPWIEALPVVREFRRRVLREPAPARVRAFHRRARGAS